MEYDFRKIEKDWQNEWRNRGTYKVTESSDKPKFYVLDMFPYPSGAGLHVGHPLGYIASDIYARYMRHKGFNVLHPMGYDSFGLPAEQYAIQTGQHPAITTKNNIARYREQLDQLGFNYDWSREVRTSDPEYYKWTQWIFGLIYNAWFNLDTQRAEPIYTLEERFAENGNYSVNAAIDEDWYKNVDRSKFPFFSAKWEGDFTATDWASMNEEQRALILMNYRLAYLGDSVVNWCPALGTVLANDEIKDGVSERGGHPVVQKMMRQWSMRISAYAERLLTGLEQLDWSESIKEIQRNWIGRSEGASIVFDVDGHAATIEVFTTRPDTLFGVSFMTLAPEHPLVPAITTDEYKDAVEAYIAQTKLKTERDRQSEVKNVTGQFTGAHVIHPFTGEKIPVWIGEYVLAGYGTGAVMAVPCGDQRDWDFATKFGLPIPNILEGIDVGEKADPTKDARYTNSGFLDGLTYKEAVAKVIAELEARGIGKGKVNYRMRDAVFSRQRYWGEPFPIYYKNELPQLMDESQLPVTLPEVDKYLPTEDGEPPLARAQDWSYTINGEAHRYEYNTMPGWAGSSWYFLRYMDPKNPNAFADRDKVDYWGQVDLYMGGAEHATGHLLYARFWTKVLFDLGYIGFDEPFKKMINQGMIQGRSSFVYMAKISVPYSGLGTVAHTAWLSSEIYSEFLKLKKNNITLGEFSELIQKSGLDASAWNQFWTEVFGIAVSRVSSEEHENEAIRIQSETSITIVRRNADITLFDNDVLNEEEFINASIYRMELPAEGAVGETLSRVMNAIFIRNSKNVITSEVEIEKMSKSKFNVQTPDELVEKFGADTLRCYEMFLGPVEQHKPWDTKGINGVHNFLRKLWRLYHNAQNEVHISDDAATKEELKTLHKTIKKVTDDLQRLSWNTVVSSLMICVNELQEQKCNKRAVLEPLCVLLSPYAPHMAEELWQHMGHQDSITDQPWPVFDEAHLQEDAFEYPISFNGKTRFFIPLSVTLSQEEVTKAVMEHEQTARFLEGKAPKKVIVVPKRIVNVVV